MKYFSKLLQVLGSKKDRTNIVGVFCFYFFHAFNRFPCRKAFTRPALILDE